MATNSEIFNAIDFLKKAININFSLSAKICIVIDEAKYIHATRLLRLNFPHNQVNIIPSSRYLENRKDDHLLILIDCASTNSNKLAEDAFIIQTGQYKQKPALLILGGGVSGVIYAIHEVCQKHILFENDNYRISPLDIYQTPTLPYRFFWTWDHSTNWYLEQCGMQEIGFANPYLKPANGFLEDYYRLIDFMSLHRINGLIIYGFLRDSHGGIEAAKKLCQYASERGVRIFPGVGINSYGGIYWEGHHPYNLSTWLNARPELAAKFDRPKHFVLPEFAELFIPNTHYLDSACPSKNQNIDFHVEAIQWLAETFQIGGINFETGDYGTCQCSECSARRANNEQWSHQDMALVYPRLFSAAKKSRSDLWLVCEAYWDNLLNLDAIAPLADLPDDAIYQFCINRSYWNKLRLELSSKNINALPRTKNILRTHMGSQWQHERYELVAKRYSEMMNLAYTTGLQGATIFGEASSFNTVNEINYLAFARFGYDSTLTWDQFLKNDLAPLLGGLDETEEYLSALECNSTSKDLTKALTKTREIGSKTSGDVYRRWIWLQNRLFQKLAMLNN